MNNSYTPVAYEHREIIEEQIALKNNGKIFFWSERQQVEKVAGQVTKLEELPGRGTFLFLDSGMHVRIDRIITIFGKPGAAYEEYDAYAN